MALLPFANAPGSAAGGVTRETAYAQSNTTLASSGTYPISSVQFAGAGAASVGISNGSVVISAPNAGAGNITVSAGASSGGLASIVFSNSNSMSFGLNGSTITGSVSYPSQTAYVFSNSNNVSFTTNASTVVASASYSQSTQPVAFSAPGGSSAFSTLTFANSNGVSFSNSNGSVVATVATNYQSQGAYLTTAAQSNQVVNSLNGSTGQMSLATASSLSSSSNGSTISFGLASNITTALQSANANYLTTQTVQPVAFSAPGGSSNFSTLVFANSNGVSFTNSNGSLVASVQTSYLTTAMQSGASTQFVQANAAFQGYNASGTINSSGISVSVAAPGGAASASLYALGNTTQNSSTVLALSQLSYNAIGSITAGFSNGSIQISAPNALTTAMASNAVTLSNINLSAGTTSLNASAFTFSNSNGLAFGLSGNSVITGSYTVPTQSNQQESWYATGNTFSNSSGTFNASSILVNGLGSASVGFSNGSLLVSASGGGGGVTPALSGSNGSFSFSTATMGNLNGLSFYTSNGSMVGSYTVPSQTVQPGIQSIQVSNTTYTTGNVILSNANGITFGSSAGGAITASYTVPTQSVQPVAFSASGGSSLFSTLVFSNANNITFTNNAGSVQASYSQSNQAISLYAVSQSTQSSSATNNASSLQFAGYGAVSVGMSNSVVQISAPATSTLTGVGGISISTNGSTISVSYAPTLSKFEYPQDQFNSLTQTGQGSLSLQKVYVPFNVTATAFAIAGSLSAATNTSATTASAANSLWAGIYTLNGSTLSLASSGSTNNTVAWSQSASTTGNTSVNGMRLMTVPMNVNMTPGMYFIGAVLSQATTYTSMGYTLYGGTDINSASALVNAAPIGSNTTVGRPVFMGQGIFTAATASGPTSIGTSAINYTSAGYAQWAKFYFNINNATY